MSHIFSISLTFLLIFTVVGRAQDDSVSNEVEAALVEPEAIPVPTAV